MKFNAEEYQDNFIRCINNQISLLDRYFLRDMAPSAKEIEYVKSGVTQFYRAMVVINSQLEVNGYDAMPVFWSTYKEGNC